MMRFTRIYLLYAAVFAWVDFPSNAFAAACSFPLTQTAVETCDGLIVRAAQTGAVTNAGTIQSDPFFYDGIRNSGVITILTNSTTGVITGINRGIENTSVEPDGTTPGIGIINIIENYGNITSTGGGAAIYNFSTITTINNYTGGNLSGGGWVGIVNWGTINDINNSGFMSGFYASQDSVLTTLTNNFGGTIQGHNGYEAISIFRTGIVTNINNSGTISAINAAGIFNQGSINSFSNNLTGTITSPYNAIYNWTEATISNLTNAGNIAASGGDGILNDGTIISLNNTGTISGSGYSINNRGRITTGITNSGTIPSLLNKQGSWNGGSLSYTGTVPGSYYAFISSANSYGQIAFTAPTGSMNFNIAPGSTVLQRRTYSSVITGLSSLNITNTSGIYDGLSWKLVQNGSENWDLVFGYAGVSISNTLAGMANNQQSINSFLQQRYAVMAVVLNYDCANFDKYGVCISFQSRATGFGNQSTGAGVLTASHKITDKIHVGAFLDYQVNQVAPGGSSLGPGGVQSGYNNATFGGFAGYYANPDRTGLQAKISGAYNPGKVTVTRPLLENTEAGMGTAGLNGSGVYGEIGWGLGFAKTFVATPFVGIRGIDITRNGYSESFNAAVQFPISYNSYYERVLTGIAGGQIKAAITDRLNFQAGVWAELDVRRSANSYSGWSTIPGLETFALAHGGSQNRLRPAGYAGVSYEVAKNQRITANTVVREQAYSNRTNVTGLIGYQISF